ncbi:hypothetical protein D3C72_2213320 [compost metagenome]
MSAQKAAGAVTISTEMPKATNVVCTAMPLIAPSTVAKPWLRPQLMVRDTKSAISGPGVTASTKPARAKARMTERSGMKLGMAQRLVLSQ